MELAVLNENLLPLTEVPLDKMDRGLFFGDGVYEVLRSYHGRIFALEEHLSRFERSAAEIQLGGFDIAQIRSRILEAFEKAGFRTAKIYFHLTRGCELREHLPGPNLKPSFFLTVQELHDDPKKKQHGIRVCTHPDLRWKRCDIKSLNLLPNVLARIEADRKGCTEALLVNDKGLITEGAGSAFFAVNGKEKTLYTHPLGPEILPSITRAVVLRIARDVGLTPVEQAVTPQQAAQMDELFLAVTTKDILPITQFDGNPVGTGRPGPCTAALLKQFQEYVAACAQRP
ncbi:MAG TPA: aminotransferase class IV [Anaerohalosphaeraceae bacterium]|nr:aminotransferase class IV [Anaerohalosphaeraceae bacterium]HOL89983.1 aminotransferase class IV [Anaerohalosphaeraceae bacterium]HPP56593.1 aminotransferase class IV [Anaerohalosphaeraceae bacterium]